MAKANADLLAFNRGIVSTDALARTDVERTRLSAETMTNWLPKTQGPMRLRPGSKYLGSSLDDQKAAWMEFVASTDTGINGMALLEQTDSVMRVWINDALMERVPVSTTVAGVVAGSDDTGAWTIADTGGTLESSAFDQIPTMTGATTNGVTMSASSSTAREFGLGGRAWHAADDDAGTAWTDTGPGEGGTLPSWIQVDFGSGNTKTIASYTIVAAGGVGAPALDNVPRSWFFQGNDVDTGSFASWTTLDTGGDQTGWAVNEKRAFTVDSPQAFRYYRLYVTEITGGGDESGELFLPEMELFETASTGQSHFNSVGLVLNAQTIGGLARVHQEVTVGDTGIGQDTGDINKEHALKIGVTRGPVTLRVGSSKGNDDLISETLLRTGNHDLAVTPGSNFHITLQSDAIVDRIVGSVALSDTGQVQIATPWSDTGQLDNIRHDQSADVLFVDSLGVQQQRIERRGDGRSWSVVKYEPNDGPFFPARSSSAKLRINQTYGNATLKSDIPFFKPGHEEALFRIFHDGQSGVFNLGNQEAETDPVEMTGINDTGALTDTGNANNERRIVFAGSGTWAGTVTVQRSFDGPETGFHDTDFSDTGTFTRRIDDPDDNITVWYRAKIKSGDYTSGALELDVTYKNGGKTGTCRVTDFINNQQVDVEVLSRFSDTGFSDTWNEGYWSNAQFYPSSVAFHEGRLWHFGGATVVGSVSDDYESFDDEVEGDAAPINRTLATGPVDRVNWAASLLRLFIGTVSDEIALRSSSLDEPLTATNMAAKPTSSQGSTNLRALKVDGRAVFVNRSRRGAFMIEYQGTLGDYESSELTLLVPDLLRGVQSVAIQRQPDTRLHFVLEDGSVAIATYQKQEQVLCWSLYKSTAASGAVEKVSILPGTTEDQVYYHVRRTINGSTKRYLEKWAMEEEAQNDTGASWLADSAIEVTLSDTGVATGLDHLEGEQVIVWAGKDLSYDDTGGNQALYTVSGGLIQLGAADTGNGAITAQIGLPYMERTTGKEMDAEYKSSKLAYAAQAGTALTMPKRVDHVGLVLGKTHNNGLFVGRQLDTGSLHRLPRVIKGRILNDTGQDVNEIFNNLDIEPSPFQGTVDSDARLCFGAKAPRIATLRAAIIGMATNDKI